jgi:hypothetical protein
MHPAYVLIPAMVLSLALLKLNQQRASPLLGIINRWLRWGVMAGGFALIVRHFEWSERDFSALFVVFLLLWFMFDCVYRWLAIHAMSVSPLPLFPRFIVNQAGDEWPVQSRFLKLRDSVRAAGFKQIQAVRAEVATSLYVRATVYQDADTLTRLQVAFLPQPAGGVIACLHFSTRLADGRRIVTDNHYLPFGGFYPETWHIERRPRMRSFTRLLALHRERLAAAGSVAEAWTSEPLTDLNAQQIELERLNTELGFLYPSNLHEEHGRISHEGRYRVWKEMLTLDYFGRAARYE